MKPVYAIGDVHGQRAMLEAALERIARDESADATVVLVGDYIDRGPDSRGVIELLMQGQSEGRDWICLAGNHDVMLLEYLDGPDPANPSAWIGLRWLSEAMGGTATLRSYGVDVDARRRAESLLADARDAVPRAHVDWLRARPRMHCTDDHVFVHAGIRPGVPIDRQNPEDLIWIRRDFLDDPRDHGRLIVHGHTPEQRPTLFLNRLNLDGGAGWGRPLTPVRLLGREAFLLEPIGETRL